MAQTPLTSDTPYLTAARLWDFIDHRIVAGLLRDDDTVTLPTKADMEGSGEYGLKLANILKAGSGEVESACLPRGQYQPSDLAALTGNARANLERLTAGCVVLVLFGRRAPVSGRHEDLPAARYAQDALERLRLGERVFGFVENTSANGMSTVELVPPSIEGKKTVQAAYRFFGNRYSNN